MVYSPPSFIRTGRSPEFIGGTYILPTIHSTTLKMSGEGMGGCVTRVSGCGSDLS